jgi:uncharacterized protein
VWLREELDTGEAAVIQTALEHGECSVVFDDLKARRIARRGGLSVTGTVGVLLVAKHNGVLDNITEALANLAARGMWISDDLRRAALLAAGEGL